jgi:hypothetical protein
MEQYFQTPPLSPSSPGTMLHIDDQSRFFLGQSAKWAKFLAIVGFVYCGLIIIMAFFIGTLFSMFSPGNMDGMNGSAPGMGMVGGGFFTVFFIAFAILYFFPCLYLFNFANKMQAALQASDQGSLTVSFQNLRANLRFMGILVIIGICLYGLALIIAVITGLAM